VLRRPVEPAPHDRTWHFSDVAGLPDDVRYRTHRGRKARLAVECIVAVPDLEEAKAIASKKLIGADEITATKLSRAKIKALNLKEGDVRL
jgi:hypothetical protein